ncbi:DUF4192 domain-containing protein [Streptomyces sp. INA 01156]
MLPADLRDDELLRHDEAATLILGLQDRTTRDRAAAWMEGEEAGPALRLWRALARRCVGSYGEHAAAPLTLAGWVAWSTGDELEAREALAMALGADPDYLFARLLHRPATRASTRNRSAGACGRNARATGRRTTATRPSPTRPPGPARGGYRGAGRTGAGEPGEPGERGGAMPSGEAASVRRDVPRRRRRTQASGTGGGPRRPSSAGHRPGARIPYLRDPRDSRDSRDSRDLRTAIGGTRPGGVRPGCEGSGATRSRRTASPEARPRGRGSARAE